MNIKLWKNFILDLFFPKKCLGCGKHDTYLCNECFSKIEIIQDRAYYVNYANLDKVISATNYAHPLIRKSIKALKYGFAKELAKPLSQLIIKKLKTFNFGLLTFNFIIVPVPLHSRKLRERGFNQAELIAKEIADYFNLPMKTNILKRIIFTSPQADIKNDFLRKQNIENAFQINPQISISGKIILLVDDVITTGATLIEAAKILKTSGAKEIWALTIARG